MPNNRALYQLRRRRHKKQIIQTQVAGIREPEQSGSPRIAFPARHKQMEQNRTQAVLLYQQSLEGAVFIQH
jgi:hypothetical protein